MEGLEGVLHGDLRVYKEAEQWRWDRLIDLNSRKSFVDVINISYIISLG